VPDSGPIADLVRTFAKMMRLRGRPRPDVDKKLNEQIQKSVRRHYATLRANAARAHALSEAGVDAEGDDVDEDGEVPALEGIHEGVPPSGGAAVPLELGALGLLAEELEQEVAIETSEYAAYIGLEMGQEDDATISAVEAVADCLNADIAVVFGAVEEISEQVMGCWSALRAIEDTCKDIMCRAGVEGARAKVLNVDDSLAAVASKWVVQKAAECKTRKDTSIEIETWQPVSEEQPVAVCAIDIVSMMMTVAKGYFDAALPVEALDPVTGCTLVQVLAREFGEVLVSFGITVLRQCGRPPRAPRAAAASEPKRARAPTMGRALKGMMADVIGTEAAASADEEQAASDSGQLTVQGLCLRMTTIDYVERHCEALLTVIKEGCAAADYSADWLDGALDESKTKLHGFVGDIADICAAHVVNVELRASLHESVYRPLPSAAPLITSEALGELEGHLETVRDHLRPALHQLAHPAPPRPRPAPLRPRPAPLRPCPRA
jgi:hypothetical protein